MVANISEEEAMFIAELWPPVLERQVSLVKAFPDENLLRLNGSKCELVVFSKIQSITPPTCVVEGSVILAGDMAKCLGYRWKGDLLAKKSVQMYIQKARSAFF